MKLNAGGSFVLLEAENAQEGIELYIFARDRGVHENDMLALATEGVEKKVRRAHKKHVFKAQCEWCGRKFKKGAGFAKHQRHCPKKPMLENFNVPVTKITE